MLTALRALSVGQQTSRAQLALCACMHVQVHVLQLASTGLAGHMPKPYGLAVILLVLGA